MIAKVSNGGRRGSDTCGLLRYLFGRGKANEHTNQHLIGAWDPEWLENGAFANRIGQRGWLARLARDIDAAMLGHDVQVEGGHVYHVALSVPPDDGELGDASWRELVEDAVERMGFGPDDDGAASCRWVAVHHGLSADGNDHVHLVVNLVRGDGTVANTYRDWPRWREWCRRAEDRYGLTPTAPSGEGRSKAVSRPELERAAAASSETERDQVRRIVAEKAVEAISEHQFVNLVRGAGLLVAPRVLDGQVTGYRVALDRGAGTEPLWFSGSSLRRDLSLPRLRTRWDEVLPERYAENVWSGELVAGLGPSDRYRYTWRLVARHMREADAELRRDLAAESDPVRWHQAVEQTADLVGALARVESSPTSLHRVHDQLTRAAQLPRGCRQVRRPARKVLPLLTLAARLAATSKDPAPAMFVATVVLLYAIVTTLNHYARHHAVRSPARCQMSTAAHELATHPALKGVQNTDGQGAELARVVGAKEVLDSRPVSAIKRTNTHQTYNVVQQANSFWDTCRHQSKGRGR